MLSSYCLGAFCIYARTDSVLTHSKPDRKVVRLVENLGPDKYRQTSETLPGNVSRYCPP